MLLYKTLNIWAFVFVSQVPWPGQTPLNAITDITLRLTSDYYVTWFFAIFFSNVAVFAFMFAEAMTPIAVEQAHQARVRSFLKACHRWDLTRPLLTGELAASLAYQLFVFFELFVVETCYVPTLVAGFNMITCGYSQFSYLAPLGANPSIYCWRDVHVAYAACAVVMILATYAANLYVAAVRKPFRSSLYRYSAVFETQLVFFQFMIAATGTLWVTVGSGRLLTYPLIVSMAYLFATNYLWQPCRGRAATLNNTRSGFFSVVCIGAICSAVLIELAPYSMTVGIIYVILIPSVFGAAWILNARRPEGYELPAVPLAVLIGMRTDDPGHKGNRRAIALAMGSDLVDVPEGQAGGTGSSVADIKRRALRTEVVAAQAISCLVHEEPRLRASGEAAMALLAEASSDLRHMEKIKSCLEEVFGRLAPAGYVSNGYPKLAAALTLQEAHLLAVLLRTNPTLQKVTMAGGAMYPGATRRGELDALDFSKDRGRFGVQEAVVQRELLRPFFASRVSSINLGAVPLPVGAVVQGSLTVLSLRGAAVGDADVILLADAVATSPSLTSLDLSHNAVGYVGLRALGEMLARNPPLEELDLLGNALSYGATDPCVKAYRALGRGLAHNRTLRRLRVSPEWIPAYDVMRPRKPEVDLSGPDVFNAPSVLLDEGAAVVALLLGLSPMLVLRLRKSGIGWAGAQAVAYALAPPKGFLSGKDAAESRGLQTRSPKSPIPADGPLHESPDLQELDLTHNGVGDAGCTLFGRALRLNYALRVLRLGHNGIGPQGAAALATGLRPGMDPTFAGALEELYLEHNPLGPTGAAALAGALGPDARGQGANARLLVLSLAGCGVGVAGAQAVGGMLAGNPYLTALDLSENGIEPDPDASTSFDPAASTAGAGVASLAGGLATNLGLTSLELRGNGLRRDGLDGHAPGRSRGEPLAEAAGAEPQPGEGGRGRAREAPGEARGGQQGAAEDRAGESGF